MQDESNQEFDAASLAEVLQSPSVDGEKVLNFVLLGFIDAHPARDKRLTREARLRILNEVIFGLPNKSGRTSVEDTEALLSMAHEYVCDRIDLQNWRPEPNWQGKVRTKPRLRTVETLARQAAVEYGYADGDDETLLEAVARRLNDNFTKNRIAIIGELLAGNRQDREERRLASLILDIFARIRIPSNQTRTRPMPQSDFYEFAEDDDGLLTKSGVSR